MTPLRGDGLREARLGRRGVVEVPRREDVHRDRLVDEAHAGERAGRVVRQVPVADALGADLGHPEARRPLRDDAVHERHRVVQRVAETGVHPPAAAGVVVGRQPLDDQGRVVPQGRLVRTARLVHPGHVDGDLVAQRRQQRPERPVELVAVAAAPAGGHPPRGLGRVDPPALRQVDPERLVGNPLDVRAVQPGQGLGGRRLGLDPETVQVCGDDGVHVVLLECFRWDDSDAVVVRRPGPLGHRFDGPIPRIRCPQLAGHV